MSEQGQAAAGAAQTPPPAAEAPPAAGAGGGTGGVPGGVPANRPAPASLLGGADPADPAASAGGDGAGDPAGAGDWSVDGAWFGDVAAYIDETALKGFGSVAKGAKLSADQAKAVAEYYASTIQLPDPKAIEAAATAELKTAWGRDYDANLALASRAARDLGMADALVQAGLAAEPLVLQLLAKVGGTNAEGTATDRPKPGAGRMGKAQAEREISRLLGDQEFSKSYWDKYHPDHDAAVTKMDQLYKIVG